MLPTVLSEHHHTSWKCCSSPKNSKDLVNYQKYKCGEKERDVVQKVYHELSELPDITAKRLNSLSKLHLDSFWVLTSTVYSKKCPLKVITDSVALKRVQKQDNKQMKTHPGKININDNKYMYMNKLHKGNHPSSFLCFWNRNVWLTNNIMKLIDEIETRKYFWHTRMPIEKTEIDFSEEEMQ